MAESKHTEWSRKTVHKTRHDASLQMKAAEWHGKQRVEVHTRPVPVITDPDDVIVKITSTCICGSDLHLYNGTFPEMRRGDVMGHEGMGIIEAVGSEVKNRNVGDRVVICFDMGCPVCFFCKHDLYSLCDSTNPSPDLDKMYGDRTGGFFGYTHLTGGWEGEQAQFVRVPFAEVNTLKVPSDLPDQKVILLSDIYPTAWHGNVLGETGPGKSVAIWGCGPVGILAAHLAKFRGAERVVVIDQIDYRLRFVKEKVPGVETINFSMLPEDKDVPDALKELMPPHGPDVGIECVGNHYTKTAKHKLQMKTGLEQDPPEVLNEMIKGVRKGGNISIIGAYAGFTNEYNLGGMMEKHMTVRGGQCPCQKYWPELLKYVVEGKTHPEMVITHEPPLEKAPQAYKMFNNKEDNCIKVVMHPIN